MITACAVNIKPSKAADKPTATPTILDGATPEYTGTAQKIVTDLPDGMRYYITTEQIDPTTIDAGKIVPKGYTALDYLKSTGTQYIDTGFKTTTGMVARFAAEWHGSSTSDCVIGSNSTLRNYALLRPEHGNWEFGFGNKILTAGSNYSANTKYMVQFSTISRNGYLEVNNERLITDNSAQNTPANINVLLFTSAMMESMACRANVYYTTIWDSAGKLVRDFVPVSKDNGDGTFTLGMYDVYNDVFYKNDGTDEFIPGETVNTAIKDWEWSDSVDDEQNNVTLQANTKYYVYYYTPNTDTTTVTPLAVKEFYVNCTNHVYGEWTTTTPATCTTDGVREHTCTGCGHTENEVIPATGHDYQIADDVPATCTEAGYTRYECTHCHDDYQTSGAEQKPLGHQYLPENDTVTQPSCTEAGYTTHICERCRHTYQSDYVPATGHNYSTWTTTEPATTEHAGEQKRTCHCGAEQVRTIPALAGTTTDGGKDNTAPLLWGIIIGVIAVLAGCGGLAWLLIVLFKPKKKEKVAAA